MFEYKARHIHSATVAKAITYIRVADLSQHHPTAQEIDATRVGDKVSNSLVP